MIKGEGTGGAKSPHLMYLEIGKILAHGTPNISRSKEGALPKNVISTFNLLQLLAPLNDWLVASK